MNNLNTIALLLTILIFVVTLFIILFKFYRGKIENILIKTNDAEKDFFDKIKRKQELLINMIDIVTNKYKIESKTFEEVKNTKIESAVTFKSDKLFNKCYGEVISARNDNKKKRELKSFAEDIDNYEDNELHIISLRTYYNKYTLYFNNLIKKFPYNAIAKFKKYKLKVLLEGKELDNSFNNDLEV